VQKTKIISFSDLIAWQKSVSLVKEIYLRINSFPKDETYALSSQIKRAAVSIPANIAEGFSRHSSKEKIQFYFIALGSLTELQSHLYIALELTFINKAVYERLKLTTIEVSKLINGLIKSLSY